jgi:SAM-dependent methyltransferase
MASRTISVKSTSIEWDQEWYLRRYPDVAAALRDGTISDPLFHFLQVGLREGRYPSAAAEAEGWPPGASEKTSVGSCVCLGDFSIPLNWPVHGEVGKSFALRLTNGFFQRFLSGPVILDIGFRGASKEAAPILPHAKGIDLDYPGYDGVSLPFTENSVDTVFASHVLEHVPDAQVAILDWFRVLKLGGYLVCIVPHQYLYERKQDLPSRWSSEHLHFYTPASLIKQFESALIPNTYRVRHLMDNDLGYDYQVSLDRHPYGCYEIELVIEKITAPTWRWR